MSQIHLRTNYLHKRRRTKTSAYCNRGMTSVLTLGIDAFLAVHDLEPDMVCKRCLARLQKKGFDVDPQAYHDEQSLLTLANTEL